jgi:hypothetical protein
MCIISTETQHVVSASENVLYNMSAVLGVVMIQPKHQNLKISGHKRILNMHAMELHQAHM